MKDFKFGKNPVRSLESFGVSGLLNEGCQVFYDSIFSTKHLGRVTDLINAKFGIQGAAEFKLRAVVLFTAYEGYFAAVSMKQPVPISLEFGSDEEKIAIGISFQLPTRIPVNEAETTKRITSGTPKGALEELAVQITKYAGRVVMRYQAGQNRLEIVSLLALPGKISDADAQTSNPFIFVNVQATSQQVAPAKTYTELGDLPYAELLKADASRMRKLPYSSGDFSKVSGGDQNAGKFVTVIAADQAQTPPPSVQTISGTGESINDTQTTVIAGSKTDGSQAPTLLNKIFPFLKKKKSGGFGISIGGGSESMSTETSNQLNLAMDELEAALDYSEGKKKNPEKDAAGADAEKVKDVRAENYKKNLISDIVAARGRLVDLAKKLNQSIRKKEIEIKSSRDQMKEEIRKREEIIKQREAKINHLTEQMSVFNNTIENLKDTMHDGEQDTGMKQRFAMSQKMIATLKEENLKLYAKIEKLRETISDNKASVRNDAERMSEIATLSDQLQKSQRSIDDLRKTNQELSDRNKTLQAASKEGAEGRAIEALKQKLAAAATAISVRKKEVEQLSSQLSSSKQQELQMKMELEKSRAEVRKLKRKIAGLPPEESESGTLGQAATKPGEAKPGEPAKPDAKKPAAPAATKPDPKAGGNGGKAA